MEIPVYVGVGVAFGELGALLEPQEDNNAPPKIKKDPHAAKALLFITAPIFIFLKQIFFSPHSGQQLEQGLCPGASNTGNGQSNHQKIFNRR
jgi:hypothetical protein